ncbi:MAG: phosphate acetyltransferase [Oceanicoccus sp.]|jgi:phosphate acetyltransferase
MKPKMTHPFLQKIKDAARKKPARVLFAEGSEPRVMEAAKLILEEGVAIPLLVKVPSADPRFQEMAALYAKLREKTIEEAREATMNAHVFATLLLKAGHADALISGPSAASKERMLPAFQIIRAKEEGHKASAYFTMLLPKTVSEDAGNGGVLLFADCAVNIEPSVETLAQIAIDTAESAKALGIDPKVAMLSFSTEGSSDHPKALRIREAAAMVHKQRPDLLVSNDMQADAALIDSIGESKAHENIIAGHANVLIFPDLESGNIAYKLVERLANAQAIGPIIQGLNQPVNELSRGCDAEDIVNLAALTSALIKQS